MLIVGSTFEKCTEILDGKTYRSCEFRECELIYTGGPRPSITGCRFIDCRWVLAEAASRTVEYLRDLWKEPGARRLVEGVIDQIRGLKPNGENP